MADLIIEREAAPAERAVPGEGPTESSAAPHGARPGRQDAEVYVVREIPVDTIRPNPRQPRQVFDDDALGELAASIAQIGLLQPLVVRPDSSDEEAYELVAGERRFRCVQRLGWDIVPAVIRHTEDRDMLRDALLENVHRANLNPLEEAAAYQQLLADFGCTQEELSERVGRSRPQISNTIRLLRLPPAVQRRVAAGVLSQGHARALLALPSPAHMEALATRIVAEGLSVRTVEEIVALGEVDPDGTAEDATRRTRRPAASAPGLTEVADQLADHLDTRVQVTMGRAKGRLTIEFAGQQDLARILDVLLHRDPPEGGSLS